MAKKSSRALRSTKSVLGSKSPGRVGRVLAAHGLLPSTKPQAYSSNELINKVLGSDFTESEPACAIIASLFDIAAEENSPEIEDHLKELMDGGLFQALQRPWADGGARKIANDELPRKICCLMVFKSYFNCLAQSPGKSESTECILSDEFLSLLSQSLEEALNCINNADQGKYHISALKFCRMVFSCLDGAVLCHPVQLATFARTCLPGILRDVPLVTLALRIAIQDISSEVKNMLLADPGLRASAAEFVAGICQSLSEPEDINPQQLQAFVKEETRILEACHYESLALNDFLALLERIRCVFFIASACLEWEIKGPIEDIKSFVGRAMDAILAVDNEGILLVVKVAAKVTEAAEQCASQERIGDFQDFASLLNFMELSLSTIEIGVTLIEEENIKAHLPIPTLETWLVKHFYGSALAVNHSLSILHQLNLDARQQTLRFLGTMIATIGRVAENEIGRLAQFRKVEMEDTSFGTRKVRIKAAVDQFCTLVKVFHVLDVAASVSDEPTLEAWENALGISFEFWYVNHQALVCEGLSEQYQEALKFLPAEAHSCFRSTPPEEIVSFLGVVVPTLLIKAPVELKTARASQLEFYRWLVLCSSLLGQLCPPFFSEQIKIAALEIFTQCLQLAIADKDEFGFRHYGIAILAEAMFGIMDNLAEDGFHHLYNAMRIEALITDIIHLVSQQIGALQTRASKRQETEALARLEDATVNFQAFREYKAGFKQQ